MRAHIVNRFALGMALDLGIDIVDHGDELDDDCIAQMVEQGTFYVPSVYFPKHFAATMGAANDVPRIAEYFPPMSAADISAPRAANIT